MLLLLLVSSAFFPVYLCLGIFLYIILKILTTLSSGAFPMVSFHAELFYRLPRTADGDGQLRISPIHFMKITRIN